MVFLLTSVQVRSIIISVRAFSLAFENFDVGHRTRRKALLQLVGLVGILEHQGVKVALAPHLELCQAGLFALFDPGVYKKRSAFGGR